MNNLIVLLFFVPILTLILLVLNLLLAVHRPDEQKVSAYECGFKEIPGQTVVAKRERNIPESKRSS